MRDVIAIWALTTVMPMQRRWRFRIAALLWWWGLRRLALAVAGVDRVDPRTRRPAPARER
ncbi:MAG TPA: hypothetical protein VEA81_06670 [Burkholderiaceae bacterium]|nr:hypothetical protein [Burkholderiaceae bacterium]